MTGLGLLSVGQSSVVLMGNDGPKSLAADSARNLPMVLRGLDLAGTEMDSVLGMFLIIRGGSPTVPVGGFVNISI